MNIGLCWIKILSKFYQLRYREKPILYLRKVEMGISIVIDSQLVVDGKTDFPFDLLPLLF